MHWRVRPDESAGYFGGRPLAALIFINLSTASLSEISPNPLIKFNRLVGTVLTSMKEINESQGSTALTFINLNKSEGKYSPNLPMNI